MDIAVRLLNGLLMIAMPIALGIYLARRTGQRWKLYLVGAVLFVASQVQHIPFNLVVLNPILEQLGFGDGSFNASLVVGALLLGLFAGLFEEITRWLGLRYWIKEARSWSSSLMYGAGWGGISMRFSWASLCCGRSRRRSFGSKEFYRVSSPPIRLRSSTNSLLLTGTHRRS